MPKSSFLRGKVKSKLQSFMQWLLKAWSVFYFVSLLWTFFFKPLLYFRFLFHIYHIESEIFKNYTNMQPRNEIEFRCKWFRAHQLFEPIILHWSTTVSMICEIKICNTIFFFKCKIKSTEMLAHRALNHWHSYNVALYLQNLGKLWTIFGSPIYTITR